MYETMARDHRNILDATLRVIAQGGVNSVRYREVAAEAGVALGTVSYQFPSREELLRAAFQHFAAENMGSLRVAASAKPIETPADVASFCIELLRADFARSDRAHLAEYELLVYAARDSSVADVVAASDRTLALEIGAVLEHAGVSAPFSMAQTLIDLIRGFQLASLGKRDPDLAGLHKRLLRLLGVLGPIAPAVVLPISVASTSAAPAPAASAPARGRKPRSRKPRGR